MEGTYCNGEGGWTRVAFVNMSEPNATCPTGLTQVELSNLTLCSITPSNEVQSTFFTTLGLNYNAVCGRLRGYQLASTDAFNNFDFSGRTLTVDQLYVDGVSITHGANPRQHVWTYVVGDEDDEQTPPSCPCNTGSFAPVPSFVGENYYCESGTSQGGDNGVLYTNDPLWDGMQCLNRETPCCTNSNLPWFSTTLPEGTTDDLEIRLIYLGDSPDPLELIELYIR